MTDLRKAAEQYIRPGTVVDVDVETTAILVDLLRQALAQPKQEPECVGVIGNWGRIEWREDVFPQLGDRLYSAPPKREWVEITKGECDELFRAASDHIEYAYAIEAKLKEKNT